MHAQAFLDSALSAALATSMLAAPAGDPDNPALPGLPVCTRS